MIRRLLPFLLAAMVLVVGLGSAQEPAGPDDPPLRLKKKKRTGDAPPAPKLPGAGDKDNDPAKPKLPTQGGGKEKAKEDDPLEPEDGRADPEEDEKEVLDRIGRNMRGVEEKLGNRELGEPTSQQMRDIVRDLKSLIKKQQRNQGGGEDQQPQNGGGGEQDKNQDKQQGKQSQSRQQSRSQSGQGKQRGKQRQRRQRSGRQRGNSSGQPKSGTGSEQRNPQQQPGSTSNSQSGGGKSPQNNKNLNADLYKEVWGHLPESLRAEMNAYSNPSPFLPRYDDLIKKYYRTIAEQGRKKGD
jgi:hypothetical protein